jgi:hypothetical protein
VEKELPAVLGMEGWDVVDLRGWGVAWWDGAGEGDGKMRVVE